MKLNRLLTAIAISTSMLAAEAAQALPAAPARTVVAAAASNAPLVQSVDYRGYRSGYYGGGYRGGYRGRNIGLGIAAAIVGGVIISQAARADGYGYRRTRYAGRSAAQQCADTYRSYDWDSGTYMGYDGERHVCPYLR